MDLLANTLVFMALVLLAAGMIVLLWYRYDYLRHS